MQKYTLATSPRRQYNPQALPSFHTLAISKGNLGDAVTPKARAVGLSGQKAYKGLGGGVQVLPP